MMKCIVYLPLMLVLAGCAGAPVRQDALQPPKANSGETPANNVYNALERLLQQGGTVNVMVNCASSCDGLSAGYRPQDFGCVADNDTIAETEKFVLLESLGKYPGFSVVDRSCMDTSIKEINLGLNGTTDSDLKPGKISGVTHLIVIEVKNHFTRESGITIDHYSEIKKLLDVQKDTVLAMDRYSDSHEVAYRPVPREAVTVAVQAAPPPARRELSQLPPRIEVTPAAPVSRLKANEVISIHGHRQEYPGEDETPRDETAPAAYRPETAFQQETMLPRQASVSWQPPAPRRIPDWQLARALKQRFPRLRDKDDKTIVRGFIERHPRAKDKVIITSPQPGLPK